MVDVDALIAAARDLNSKPETVRVEVLLGRAVLALEFEKVTGKRWSDLTAKNPPRIGSRLDDNVGFNSDAVAGAYPSVSIVDAGVSQRLDAAKWAELFAEFDSPAIKTVAAALWGLNQLDPTKRFIDAKKAMAGASETKQN